MASNNNERYSLVRVLNSLMNCEQFWIGDVGVLPQHNTLVVGEHSLQLQPKAMAVLCCLANHSHQVLNNDQLMDEVWPGRVVTASSVQKNINAIRKVFEQLGVRNEVIKHYSKRGYQLVLPVQMEPLARPDSTEREADSAISIHFFLKALGVIFVVVVAIYCAFWLDQSPLNADSESTYEIWGEDAAENWRRPEPHIESSRIAYVAKSTIRTSKNKEAGDVNQSNENVWLMIRNRNNVDWKLSSSEGDFIDLAWSPSGRNIVGLEQHKLDGGDFPQGFFDRTSGYFSFHVYTLDFKGEHVIEKNTLSHWQGRVFSVTWVDENTLEFIASQGLSVSVGRYRYAVASQTLSKLSLPVADFTPLKSRMNGDKIALLGALGTVKTLVVLQGETVLLQQALAAQAEDVSWLDNGNALLVSMSEASEHSPHQIVALEGEIGRVTRLRFPKELNQNIQHIREADRDGRLLLEYESVLDIPSTLIQSSEHNWELIQAGPVGRQNTFVGDGLIELNSSGFVGSVIFEFNQSTSPASLDQGARWIPFIWSVDKSQAVFVDGDRIQSYDKESVEQQTLMTLTESAIPVAYNAAKHSLWVVKFRDMTRNVWQLNLATQEEIQLTFGQIGSVSYGDKGLYFQYVSQPGLWRLDMTSGEIRQVSRSLPQNSQILMLASDGAYFVTGTVCRESPVYYFDFIKDSMRNAGVRKQSSHRVHTLAFSSDLQRLVRTCRPFPSSVVTAAPQ